MRLNSWIVGSGLLLALCAAPASARNRSAADTKPAGRAPGDVVKSEWRVAFSVPAGYRVASDKSDVVMYRDGARLLIVRPVRAASIREYRVVAKRGMHAQGYLLDAQDVPEDLNVAGLDAAKVPVAGVDPDGNKVVGRLLVIGLSGERAVAVIGISPVDELPAVEASLEALSGSVKIPTATSGKTRGRSRG